MAESQNGRIEQSRGIHQRGMGTLIVEDMREFTLEGLGDHQIRLIAGRNQESRRRAKKLLEARLKPAVERVIAGGEPRSGDVQAEASQGISEGDRKSVV